MWGGLTIPAAQFHDEVYAVDKTIETLQFLKIRAGQMGFDNIRVVASGVRKLPFPDGFFDLVVLNGVLEWTALEEKVILEKDWKKPGRGLRTAKRGRYTEDPYAVQLEVLKEMRRVLKPGGALYLAIENRFGYVYLAGYPDDHMNMSFICFMPRFLANAVTKLFLRREYRTYVHGVSGYRKMLKKSGYGAVDLYGVFMHYIRPSEMVPLDLVSGLKKKIVSTKRGLNKILLNALPAGALKWVSPSIAAVASRDASDPLGKPRIISILEQAGVMGDDCGPARAAKCDSRSGNGLTANYLIYNGRSDTPEYFCKVCRDNRAASILANESRNMDMVKAMLERTSLSSSVPEKLYHGTVDDVTFMVTRFIDARRSDFVSMRLLRTGIKALDRDITSAMRFLSDFQKNSIKREIGARRYFTSFIEESKKHLEEKGILTKSVKFSLNALEKEVKGLGDETIFLCAQHGDFDFFYNILFDTTGVRVLDFEHFMPEALPLLDLATLIFNPILMSLEHEKIKIPLRSLVYKHGLLSYIRKWLDMYAEFSGMSVKVLRLIAPLAALEQKTRNYPEHRDPGTFPINAAFEEMMGIRIDMD
jgi:SAM-dependent methyltransferase